MSALRRIAIQELTLGSFVASVTKQKGFMRIKQSGWVRSEAVKQALINKGIVEVEVDDERHYDLIHPPKVEQAVVEEEPVQEETKPLESFDSELTRAKEVIQESKRIQRKVILNIQQHNPVEVEQLEYLSNNLIASIDRNPNAVSCLAKIKSKSAQLLEDAIRCATLMVLFANHRELDENTTQALAIGALLHNIGKVKLPDELLSKSNISTEERMQMHTFIQHNQTILNAIEDLPAISQTIATQFKERLDGSGYPAQLSEESLNEHTRMMSIVELYNELTNGKPGQPGVGPINAYRQMMDLSPAQLDPNLLPQFIKCIGIYPAGTLVRLKSGKVGMVIEANLAQPTRPKIKLFYNAKHQHHIDVKTIDLALYPNEEIEACVGSDKYRLDLSNYI